MFFKSKFSGFPLRKIFQVLLMGGMVLLSSLSVNAGDVVNGSFEKGESGKVPEGWKFDQGTAKASIYLVANMGATEGNNSLFISNKSSYQPQVYSSIFQYIDLRPNVRYKLSCDIKGQNASGIAFILGERWQVRLHPEIKGPWTHFEEEFTLKPEDITENGAMVRICTEKTADGVWIDNLHIKPVGGCAVTPAEFQKERVYMTHKLNGPLDKIKDIPSRLPTFSIPENKNFYTGKNFPNPEDFQAKIALAYSSEGIIILADVKKKQVNGAAGNLMWNADCLQLHINPYTSFSEDYEPEDVEVGLSPSENGVNTWCWQLRRALKKDEAEVTGGIVPGGYRIRALLKWKLFKNPKFSKAHTFSFNAIFNVYDDGVREVAYLQRGIHDSKNKKLNTLAFFDRGTPFAMMRAKYLRSPVDLPGTLYFVGMKEVGNWTMPVELVDSKGEKVVIPLKDMPPLKSGEIAVREIKLPLAKLSEGKYTVNFLIENKLIGKISAEKIDLLNRQLPELAALQKRFDAAQKAIKKGKFKSAYLTLSTSVIGRHIALQKKYLTQKQSPEALEYYLTLGERVNVELKQSMDDLEKMIRDYQNGKRLPKTWEYKTSPIKSYKNGLPVVKTTNESGKTRWQGQLFSGYGHFNDAIRDLDYFQKIGANTIQFEFGPRNFFPREGKESDFSDPDIGTFKHRIEPALKKAYENNVKIILLISPHYHPRWWLRKYPQLKRGNGLCHYEVNAPEARLMLNAYMDCVMPLLRDSKYADALHSIVTMNEPNYAGATWTNSLTQQFFRKWLKKEFGTIQKFNKISGQKFKSFDEVQKANPVSNPAVNFEFQRYRRVSFAEFHRYLDRKVKKYMPEMKTSVKIMMGTTFLPMGVDFAVDPELFAEFSDYNGNDNGTRWFDVWLGHDLQYSMKPIRIINSENHMVRDGETEIVKPEKIYTAVFEQFLQGAGGLVTWVWVQNTYEVHMADNALRGCIYHRPTNIIAHGRANLDANRLIEPINAFVEAKSEIAVLYSPSSLIQNPQTYSKTLRDTYKILALTGHKISFISEKQLQSAKFARLKAIVATDASHIPEGAAKGLLYFNHKGGKIFCVGNSLKYDSYGQPLAKIPYIQVEGGELTKDAVEAWDKRFAEIQQLPLALEYENPDQQGAVFFRMIKDKDGSWLVNVVNYDSKAYNIKLSGKSGKFYDLIAQKTVPGKLELKPLTPLFLRFIPDKQ